MLAADTGWGPPKLAPGARVWHYTSPTALVGIVTNRELWATEAPGLNDVSEIEQERRFISSGLPSTTAKLSQLLMSFADGSRSSAARPSDVFVLAASLVGDDASQWCLQGGERMGFALELDTDVPLGVVSGTKRETDRAASDGNPSWVRMGEIATVAPWYKVAYTTPTRKRCSAASWRGRTPR